MLSAVNDALDDAGGVKWKNRSLLAEFMIHTNILPRLVTVPDSIPSTASLMGVVGIPFSTFDCVTANDVFILYNVHTPPL